MMLKLLSLLVTFAVHLGCGNEHGECSKGRDDFISQVIQSFYTSLEAAECELARNVEFVEYNPCNGEYFDYIIIGAGPAGCLLANKLSENPNIRVLLLEAGGDPTITTEATGLLETFIGFEEVVDWGYFTEPEDGIYWGYGINGSINWPRGKGLGGSTLLHSMIFTRGVPDDYDDWANAGNENWSYNDLLPLFIELENMTAEEVLNCESCMKYHGTEGGLVLESHHGQELDKPYQAIADGLNTLGYGTYPDYNNPEMAIKGGLYFIQSTIKNGRRNSAAKAFLTDAQYRTNLRISKNSLATKILINNDNVAYGVRFTNPFGNSVDVYATKQVISSAGVINTPQLMMLSGIGPTRLLNDLGINTITHSPFVGVNLHDQTFFQGLVISINKQPQQSTQNLLDQIFQYLTRTSGPILTTVDTTIYINSGVNNYTEYPDVSMYIDYWGINSTELPLKVRAYTPDVAKVFTDLNAEKDLIILSTVLLKPQSRGRILLNSSNPTDYPKIYAGYYSNENDFKTVIGAIRIIEKVIQTKPMQDIGAKLELLQFPRCVNFVPGSDEYWECTMRYVTTTVFNPCCTMKMGPDTDSTAVIDSNLKVRGIKNLTVADLSVPPTLTSGHNQAATYVIAMKAAKLLMNEFADETNPS